VSVGRKISATVRTLTDDEARAWRARFDAQMESFRRAYETSTGIERHRYLLAALAADPDYRVPSWLHAALCEQQAALLRREHDVHWMRWFMVYEARYRKGLTWSLAYEDASDALKGELAEGRPRTMRESYRIVVRRNRRRR
jgi:hypothetical protein